VLWFALFGAAVTIGFTPVPWPDCAPAPRDKALLRATVGADVRAGRDRLTQSRVQSTTYPLKWAETPSAALTWTICSLPQHAVHPSRVAPLESRAFPESRSDLAPDGRRVSRERIRIGHTYRDKCLRTCHPEGRGRAGGGCGWANIMCRNRPWNSKGRAILAPTRWCGPCTSAERRCGTCASAAAVGDCSPTVFSRACF
jgi:hypothetical protein